MTEQLTFSVFQSMFSNQNGIRLEIDNIMLTEKFQKTWIFSKTFLNNPCFKEEFPRKKKIFEHIKICEREKIVLSCTFIAFSAWFEKEECLKLIINFYFNEKSKYKLISIRKNKVRKTKKINKIENNNQ